MAAYNVPKTGASVFPFRCVTFLVDIMVVDYVVVNNAVVAMTAFYTKPAEVPGVARDQM